MEENNVPNYRCLGEGDPKYKQYEICSCTGDCAYKGLGAGLRPSCNYDEATHTRFLSDLENLKGGNKKNE